MTMHGTFNPNNVDGFSRTKFFKMQADVPNIYRVLPPFKSLAENGAIAKYWALFWLTDSRGKKKPIPSILRKGRDGTILQADPIFDKAESLRKSLEAMKQDEKANPALVKALEERVFSLNLDKGYYINVMSLSGEIGVLKLRYTAFQNLKKHLKTLANSGIDAINVGTGVFFNFEKTKDDQGRTVYPVSVYTKTYKDPQTGKIVSETVEAPIDETTLKRMETEASDLSTLYKTLSIEEQALLATLDPSVVDRIFSRSESAENENAEVSEEDEEFVAPTVTVRTTVSAEAGSTATPPSNSPSRTVSTEDVSDLVGQFLRTGQL